MATQMYCFVAGGDVHCIPVEDYYTAVSATSTAPTSASAAAAAKNTTEAAAAAVTAVAADANALANGNGSSNGSASTSASTSTTVNGFLSTPKPPQSLLKIRNKNLLYSLNDPSLSDLDSAGENDTSLNEDDDEDDDDDAVDSSSSSSSSSSAAGPATLAKKSLYLPQFTVDLPTNLENNFEQVKDLLCRVFPSITTRDDITVKQLTGGITNMLLSCKHTPTKFTVLMRVYGQGTNLIIDRHREFVSHLVLNSLNLAPPIYARFQNGLMYGFLPGRSLEPAELQNEKLYPLIAQQLGIWHKRVSGEDIDEGVEKLRKFTISLKKNPPGKPLSRSSSHSRRRSLSREGSAHAVSGKHGHHHKKSISNVWELIEDWMNIVPAIPSLVESFKENSKHVVEHADADEADPETIREVVQAEFEWLRTELTENSKSPIVSCHCDLLSGNIIIPEDFLDAPSTAAGPAETNPIQFIDYEYMLSAPRAFDIANHLAEWQGFDCDRQSIPDPSAKNPVMVKWVQGYINKPAPTTEEVNGLIDEISMFYGMPGFYWGIWAMIQSEISTIDFDYAHYGKLRFQEYWDWKANYLSKKRADNTKTA